MKKISIIILCTSLMMLSCKKKIGENQTQNVFDQYNPPPPPPKELIDAAKANIPSPEVTIEAIKHNGKINGVNKNGIEKAVENYKNMLKTECPKCYESVKEIK
jgi:hypothetical protein